MDCVAINYQCPLSLQSKDDVRRGLRRGCIQLKLALVGMEDECGLSIHVANRTCVLKGIT